jgi:hypothetical protein
MAGYYFQKVGFDLATIKLVQDSLIRTTITLK